MKVCHRPFQPLLGDFEQVRFPKRPFEKTTGVPSVPFVKQRQRRGILELEMHVSLTVIRPFEVSS